VALPLHRIYFDKALTFHSPDPADPSVTERVITIMLSEEYRAVFLDFPFSHNTHNSRATPIGRALD
jgi:hypothetical protein